MYSIRKIIDMLNVYCARIKIEEILISIPPYQTWLNRAILKPAKTSF